MFYTVFILLSSILIISEEMKVCFFPVMVLHHTPPQPYSQSQKYSLRPKVKYISAF